MAKDSGKTPGRKRKWSIGDYFIQLSIVVAGILLTFQGTAMVEKRSQRRDAAHILEMVSDELGKNLVRVESQKELLIHEYAGAAAMKPYINRYDQMPADSLAKYIDVITRSRNYGFITHSFEVLKGSAQIQTVRNKELLRDIFEVYDILDNFYSGVESYNAVKERGMQEYISSIDSDTYEAAFNDESFHMIFAYIMKNHTMRNYIIATGNGNNVDYLIPNADALAEKIGAVRQLIKHEIKRHR